ncbi:MAG: hypothetical protein ACI9W4_002623 [Rhodothermales bacterium]|jgi:hypothetical protein
MKHSFSRLNTLPPEARLWLYAASRPLSEAEAERIGAEMNRFMLDWSSHGREVLGIAELADSRIMGVAALVPEADISGCGIDKSVHSLQALGEELGLEWLAGLSIAYRDTVDEIQVVTRGQFRKLAQLGEVSRTTPIVDLSLTTVGELSTRGLERPLGESWHAQVFPAPPVSAA